jgi:hypothetical protein
MRLIVGSYHDDSIRPQIAAEHGIPELHLDPDAQVAAHAVSVTCAGLFDWDSPVPRRFLARANRGVQMSTIVGKSQSLLGF